MSIESKVEAFAQDVDTDIDSQVDKLSLPDYMEWLKAFKVEIASRINSRIEACQEDMKS